jgi:hypothetical protein
MSAGAFLSSHNSSGIRNVRRDPPRLVRVALLYLRSQSGDKHDLDQRRGAVVMNDSKAVALYDAAVERGYIAP